MSNSPEYLPISEFEPVIGLEIHVQLKTNSKLFSSSSAAYSDNPNTNVDPVVLGHPGTLPVLNSAAVDGIVRLGLATGCSIRPVSFFARKHYFYPDLPKGYQISQFEDPICHDGTVTVPPEKDHERFDVGITRIHLEEDAGRSIHDRSDSATLLDYNRAGVPLAELVTEPDLRSPRQAYLFMRYIRRLVRYLGISDGNMQEGSLRCDANVSIRPRGESELGTKTEIKNMNSFRHVEAALVYELGRQRKVLDAGGSIDQETLLWDPDKGTTRPMRSKEDSHDYRYFRDPDLPPIAVPDERLKAVKLSMPELPYERFQRYVESLGLSAYDAGVLCEEKEVSDYYDSVLREADASGGGSKTVKLAANIVMTEVMGMLNDRGIGIRDLTISPAQLASVVQLRESGEISSTAGQEVLTEMLTSDMLAREIAVKNNLLTESSVDALGPVVAAVLADNPKQVDQYRAGKKSVIGFFIGQVMRSYDGSPDPKQVRDLLTSALEER